MPSSTTITTPLPADPFMTITKNDWKSDSHLAGKELVIVDTSATSPMHDNTLTSHNGGKGGHEHDPMDSSWAEMTNGGGSSMGGGSGDAWEREEQKKVDAEVNNLVRKENRAVMLLRVIVLVVLVAAAVATSYLVYDTFKDKEYDSFEEEYRAVSTRVVDLYRNDVLQKLWVARNLAHTITAMIQAQHLTAPNITISSFDEVAAAALQLAPVETIKWSPLLLTNQAVADFTAYAKLTEEEQAGNHTTTDLDNRRRLRELQSSAALFHNMSSPVWQASPSFGDRHNARYYNLLSNPVFRNALLAMMETKGPVMTKTYILGKAKDEDSADESNIHTGEREQDEGGESEPEGNEGTEEGQDEDGNNRRRHRRHLEEEEESGDNPSDGNERAMTLFFPVFDNDLKTNLIGSVSMEVIFGTYFSGYLAHKGTQQFSYGENVFDTDEVDAILENTCGQVFTANIDDAVIIYRAEEDLHDTNFDDLNWGTTFEEFAHDFQSFGPQHDDDEHEGDFNLEQAMATKQGQQCFYRMILYPNQAMVDEHITNEALLFSFLVALIFMFTSSIFVFFDCVVSRRQRIITRQALRTNAIVANLFPEGVRNRLIGAKEGGGTTNVTNNNHGSSSHRGKILRFTTGGTAANNNHGNKSFMETDPVADLFPECTCIFADIAGFTAWSSEREPSQVFKLLERTFADFDHIARRLGVFKVETIGDCYVAVVGLPTPRDDHAVVASLFARAIVHQMKNLLKDLEKSLGPSTADLSIRVGIHSGPVTAGVLRGEKSRFQLFGDTMNVCSRMESSGKGGMIHVSGACADKLKEAGFAEWLILREDTPEIKGKGTMITYWLRTREDGSHATSSTAGDEPMPDIAPIYGHVPLALSSSKSKRATSAKVDRLVQWNGQLLASILQTVVARRPQDRSKGSPQEPVQRKLADHNGSMLAEVEEILALPQFDAKANRSQVKPTTVVLPEKVLSQLFLYVEKVAATYRDNPFHNFEHAAHVTMSVQKLLTRIVRPSDLLSETGKQAKTASELHDHTFGITSDPLCQFAVVLSALIHDAGHPGVSNAVLVNEGDPMARKYNDQSVAEQNSVDLAFGLLDLPEFEDLRNCIYTNLDEFNRFRSTIITIVLATDIMDKQLAALRRERWTKAFNKDNVSVLGDSDSSNDENRIVVKNRKATIVLEHLIQASDVAHTMQHWHVYAKWNEKLFVENYTAYLAGRTDVDPSVGWYKGEIGFFDFYIIPLAKKLETCGVFGVSSHEYLSYAEANRHEWVLKGEEIVEGYLAKYDPNATSTSTSPSTSPRKFGLEVEC